MAPFSIIHIRGKGAYHMPGGADFIVDTLFGIRVPEVLCGESWKATCPYCMLASGRATVLRYPTVPRGRKAMSARERQLVSDRMRRYWAARRKPS